VADCDVLGVERSRDGDEGIRGAARCPDHVRASRVQAIGIYVDGGGKGSRKLIADFDPDRSPSESPLTEHRPEWSPDGTQIAFERWPVYDRDPGTPDIYTVGLHGGEPVPLVTSSAWDTGAAWSPDGTRIAFSSERDGDEEIHVVNADGSGERRLTDLPGVDATRAASSPDGTRISFVAYDGEQWDLWVVNADGGGLLKLTPRDRDDGPAVWAPDGSLLAFTASQVTGDGDDTGTYDVYTIRPDGEGERRITSGWVAMGWDLSWQPVHATDATSTHPLPSPQMDEPWSLSVPGQVGRRRCRHPDVASGGRRLPRCYRLRCETVCRSTWSIAAVEHPFPSQPRR
jgi:Tol biopolymer transport system component